MDASVIMFMVESVAINNVGETVRIFLAQWLKSAPKNWQFDVNNNNKKKKKVNAVD